jgi:hypothetical protein
MNDQTPSSLEIPGTKVQGNPFEDGDMALVLKANGEVTTLAFGIDTERLRKADPDSLTEEEQQTLYRGSALFALTLAAQTPLLMTILLEVAANPDVVNIEDIIARARPN